MVVAIIKRMLLINSPRMTELDTPSFLANVSMEANDLLINLGVNSIKIWATMVKIMPNIKRYLYLMKYLLR